MRSLWTEALLRSQEEVTLSYGVLEILGQNWTFPKLLVSDQAGGILSKAMGSRLAAQGTHIDPVPKDEHSKIGSAECAIDEIDRMVAASLLNSTFPSVTGISLASTTLYSMP